MQLCSEITANFSYQVTSPVSKLHTIWHTLYTEFKRQIYLRMGAFKLDKTDANTHSLQNKVVRNGPHEQSRQACLGKLYASNLKQINNRLLYYSSLLSHTKPFVLIMETIRQSL
jgi:hypothetical protein